MPQLRCQASPSNAFHGFLHVNSDWYILEPVDSDRRPVPPGVQSDSVLVTNLSTASSRSSDTTSAIG